MFIYGHSRIFPCYVIIVKDLAGSTTTSGSSKRQRPNDSFNSMWSKKLDMFAAVLKDNAPKLPPSSEVLAAL
jgi:hypothetical protein